MIAANHQTYIDPFWVGSPVKRPLRFLAWNEIFSWPVVGKFMNLLGAWPVRVEGGDPTTIDRCVRCLRDGGAVVVFPEGGFGSPDGSINRFKTGAVRMALEAGVPVLPVTIRGAHRAWPKGFRFPRFTRVDVIYHSLYLAAIGPGEDVYRCARRETERLAEIIRSAL